MKLPFNYINALYRKNNHGQPSVWTAVKTGPTEYKVYHGILGKTISSNDGQLKKKPPYSPEFGIVNTASDNTTFFSFLHPAKTSLPSTFTVLGMTTVSTVFNCFFRDFYLNEEEKTHGHPQ